MSRSLLLTAFCFFALASRCLGQTAPASLPCGGLILRQLKPSAVHAGRRLFPRYLRFLHPAAVGDAVLFDSILDTSYDGNPDLLWGFPTRGYDTANDSYHLNSNPFGADSLTAASGTRAAQLTLFQVGQPILITQMSFEGALLDSPNGYYTAGSIAILFFDGVYDAPSGLPASGSGANLTQKLAKTANGTNGYIIKFPQAVNEDRFYTVTFGTSGPTGSLFPSKAGMQQPMQITDPLGRFGVMIAAIPDGSSGAVWQYQQGAPNGLNRAYIYQNYNFMAATAANGGGGYAATLKPSATGKILTSNLIPGGAAVATLTGADLNAGKMVPGAGTTPPTSPALPLNPWMTFYGRKLNGGALGTGELRGRIRNLGFDPDTADSNTSVLQDGVSVPGERRPNRYRFSFITPPMNTQIYGAVDFWNPNALPPGYSIAYQQEFYAQPSYGRNNDGSNALPPTDDTPLRLNYRLRGIPAGSYSLLAQQIPVYGVATTTGGTKLIQDSLTAIGDYPGADHVSAFFPLVTISPSTQTVPGLSPDNYSNPTTLDIKLHLLADMGGGVGGTPDGVVDTSDFGVLVGSYNNTGFLPGTDPADIGGGFYGAPDGSVDTSDFAVLVGWYGFADQVAESVDY